MLHVSRHRGLADPGGLEGLDTRAQLTKLNPGERRYAELSSVRFEVRRRLAGYRDHGNVMSDLPGGPEYLTGKVAVTGDQTNRHRFLLGFRDILEPAGRPAQDDAAAGRRDEVHQISHFGRRQCRVTPDELEGAARVVLNQ